MSRRVGTEEAYPGLLTVIIGLFVTTVGHDADNGWVVLVGLAVVVAGSMAGRTRRG